MKFVLPEGAAKRIEVRMFYPDPKDPRAERMLSKLHVLRAQPGRHWSKAAVAELVDNFVDQVDKDFPHDEFRVVAIDAGRFNIVHAGARQVELAAPTMSSDEIRQRALDRAAAASE